MIIWGWIVVLIPWRHANICGRYRVDSIHARYHQQPVVVIASICKSCQVSPVALLSSSGSASWSTCWGFTWTSHSAAYRCGGCDPSDGYRLVDQYSEQWLIVANDCNQLCLITQPLGLVRKQPSLQMFFQERGFNFRYLGEGMRSDGEQTGNWYLPVDSEWVTCAGEPMIRPDCTLATL